MSSSLNLASEPCYCFDENYLEHCLLRDGSPCQIRLIHPSDHDLEIDLISRLSSDSRYMRFCGTRKCLSEAEIRYFTVVDQETHFALVALRLNEDGIPRALGVARFIRCPDNPTTAEPAVTVTDDVQGKGLGYLLSCRLAAAAYERGITTFRAVVLPNNRKAIRLLKGICLSDPVVTWVGSEVVWSIDLAHISIKPLPCDGTSLKQWRQVIDEAAFMICPNDPEKESLDDNALVLDDDVWH